jgi:RNA polymerase sigma-54 factor
MRTGLSQSTSLRQELKINPRLYQAMDLLYMPLLDLQQHLKQELLVNPFLELIEPEDDEEEAAQEDEGEEAATATDLAEAPAAESDSPKEGEVDWEEILLDGFDTPGHREEHEEKEYYEPVSVERRGLDDHLRDQVSGRRGGGPRRRSAGLHHGRGGADACRHPETRPAGRRRAQPP